MNGDLNGTTTDDDGDKWKLQRTMTHNDKRRLRQMAQNNDKQ
jgi:hypothetical protein